MIKLDPRTHLFILLISTVFWFLFDSILAIHCLVILSAIYLIINGKLYNAIKFSVIYFVVSIIVNIFLVKMALLYVIINTFVRAIPLMMISYTIISCNANKLLFAYQKLYFPKPLLVMICIIIRFFPVLFNEMLIIREGIRARSIFARWYNIIQHPVMTYECFFVPFIMRCIRLSTELGATATIRGIDAKTPRTCIYSVSFKKYDYIIIFLFSIILLTIYMGGKI